VDEFSKSPPDPRNLPRPSPFVGNLARPLSTENNSDQHSQLFLGKYSGDVVSLSHCDAARRPFTEEPIENTFWILDFAVTESPAIDFQTLFFVQSSPGGLAIFSLLCEFRMIQMHGRGQRSMKALLIRKEHKSGTKGNKSE
jgi:hypothetical protein